MPASRQQTQAAATGDVLGVGEQVYGYAAIREVLADVANAPPNRLHRFFAAHLKVGGEHITANLDGCVEHAADADFPGLSLHRRRCQNSGDRLLVDIVNSRLITAALDPRRGITVRTCYQGPNGSARLAKLLAA